MSGSIIGTRPRLPTATERALVAEWLASAGDISLAYVSRRGNDDPALFRRIVITASPDSGPTHVIHGPAGRDFWIVLTLRPVPKPRRFRSLVRALNSIRPVLPHRKHGSLPSGVSRSTDSPGPVRGAAAQRQAEAAHRERQEATDPAVRRPPARGRRHDCLRRSGRYL